MSRFIAVVSGKGGVGKTTTSINLGTALANCGKDVLVVDGNLTAPNVGLYLGMPTPAATIHDVLEEKKQLEDATYLHTSGLKILPGSIKLDALEKLDLNKIKKTFNKMQGFSQDIIIDTGAGLTKETLSVMSMADEVLIVTNPDLAAVTEAMKTIKKAEEQNIIVLGVVLNRVKQDSNEISISNVESMLDKPVIAVIPESESVRYAQAMKHPIVYLDPSSAVSLEFRRLAERLK